MHIAIIGTGDVGASLARGFAGTGHKLTLGTRRPADTEIAALVTEVSATAKSPSEAASAADVVILALPWQAAENAIKALGDLTGKTIIDCMNPLGMVDGALGLVLGHTTSGGEIVQDWLPGAHVVKTLNQIGAEMMANARSLAHPPVMFVAGNNDSAKATASALVADLGFDPHDAGDITKSRLLEPFAMTWINQTLFRGKGRDWGFAAVGKA